jgi:ABC-type multidrug transport system ATPase subunit
VDVRKEREMCEGEGAGGRFRVLVRGVKKVYRSLFDGKYAVRGVTFGVEKGSIFALLGTNGAGKTTTFKMLTGELLPS